MVTLLRKARKKCIWTNISSDILYSSNSDTNAASYTMSKKSKHIMPEDIHLLKGYY